MDVVFAIIAGLFGYVGVGAVLARLALADLIKAATRQAGETYTEERYTTRRRRASRKQWRGSCRRQPAGSRCSRRASG
jgi:hypothetical protein